MRRQQAMMRVRNSMLGIGMALALVTSVTGCAAVEEYRQIADQTGAVTSPQFGGAQDTKSVSPAPVVGSTDAESVPGSSGDVAQGIPKTDRLIVRVKTLRLEVKAVEVAIDAIRDVAGEHGGVITDMQVASETEGPIYRYQDTGVPSDGAPLSGWVTVRVPVDEFDAFVNAVSRVGKVRYQAQSSSDVTQQHVDLKARLGNLRAEEERLRQFFDAAKSVDDMLAIEQELARVRGEIESLDAQVQYLERQAAMGTVTIELVEPKDIVRPQGESWGFADAITTGVRGAATAIKVLIVVIISVAPYVIIGAALFYAIRFFVRRRRALKTTGPAPDGADTESE
ncbi:MAG: DUF4349 domain-containing protein [Actinomycetia bacterium]|nr:DUF4349 domain-containing protein [Actinomycetes bacterium]